MDLIPIFVVIAAALGIYAFTLFKRVARLEESLRLEAGVLAEKKGELEKARKDARERKDELEEAKKQLQEARGKLRKRETENVREKKEPGVKRTKSDEPAAAVPAPVIVRISDSELSAEHQRTVSRLEGEIEALKSELDSLRKKAANDAREAQRASEALARAAESPIGEAPTTGTPPPPPHPAEKKDADEVRAQVQAQLEAFKKAAVDRERDLRRELKKSEEAARHALRRAANNQQLYAVIKGQLELLEDRLAAYKLKYEGAKSLDDLKRETRRERPKKQRRRDRNGASGEALAAEGTSEAASPAEGASPAEPAPIPRGESSPEAALAALPARDEGNAAALASAVGAGHVIAETSEAPTVQAERPRETEEAEARATARVSEAAPAPIAPGRTESELISPPIEVSDEEIVSTRPAPSTPGSEHGKAEH